MFCAAKLQRKSEYTKFSPYFFYYSKILPKNKFYIWALVAHTMGNSCPAHGLPMPTWWATDARVMGTSRPTGGHREIN